MLFPVVDDHLEFRKGLLARAILEFDPADNTNREAQLQDIRVVFVTITELCVVKVPGLDHLLLREQTWRELSDRRPDKEREAIASYSRTSQTSTFPRNAHIFAGSMLIIL